MQASHHVSFRHVATIELSDQLVNFLISFLRCCLYQLPNLFVGDPAVDGESRGFVFPLVQFHYIFLG